MSAEETNESFIERVDPRPVTLAQKNKARIAAERDARRKQRETDRSRDRSNTRSDDRAKLDKFHERLAHVDIPDAFGATYPDVEPFEHLADKYPDMAESGELINHLNKASRKAGYKNFDHHIKSMENDLGDESHHVFEHTPTQAGNSMQLIEDLKKGDFVSFKAGLTAMLHEACANKVKMYKSNKKKKKALKKG